MKIGQRFAVTFILTGFLQLASAAEGEMGRGVPQFGVYSQPMGTAVVVWALDNATINFPAGCSNITLRADTMGMDTYKVAIAMMLTAQVTNRKIRFYAHGPRDGGCGVDYVQLMD